MNFQWHWKPVVYKCSHTSKCNVETGSWGKISICNVVLCLETNNIVRCNVSVIQAIYYIASFDMATLEVGDL